MVSIASTDINPDDVFFSLILIYKFEVVATKPFYYTEFSFKIWDVYQDFQLDDTILVLRFSMVIPYIFPKLYSIN